MLRELSFSEKSGDVGVASGESLLSQFTHSLSQLCIRHDSVGQTLTLTQHLLHYLLTLLEHLHHFFLVAALSKQANKIELDYLLLLHKFGEPNVQPSGFHPLSDKCSILFKPRMEKNKKNILKTIVQHSGTYLLEYLSLLY